MENMKFSRFIVTAVDYDRDGQCDGKARILGAFRFEDEAKEFVTNDMHDFIDEHTSDQGFCPYILEDDKMSAHNDDWSAGCEWNIEEVEIETAAEVYVS